MNWWKNYNRRESRYEEKPFIFYGPGDEACLEGKGPHFA